MSSLLPQSLEAEESILGAIMLDPTALGRVKSLLIPDAFFLEAHKIIYQICLDLYNDSSTTDLMSVTMRLFDRNILDTVGGQNKLAQLVERTVSAANIELYAKYVNEKYALRQAIFTTSTLAQKMREGLTEPSEAMSILKEQLRELESISQLSNLPDYSPNQILHNNIKRIMSIEDPTEQLREWKRLAKKNGGEFSVQELKNLAYAIESVKPLRPVSCKDFCSTSLPGQEWLFEGFIPGGAVSLLVAESKTGKSLLAYDIAYYASQGKGWAEFPINKPAKTLILQADEPKSDTQRRMIIRGMDKLDNVHVEHHFSIYQFAALKRMIEEQKYEFVIIDSLISMARGKNLNDVESSLFLYALKDLASETGVPILLIHHTNKTGDGQSKTSLSRIANSYAIAACSSVAFMLTYPDNALNPNERILTASGSRVHENQKAWKLELSPEDFSWEYLGECDKNGALKDDQESIQDNKNLGEKIINLLSQRKGKFYPIPQLCELLDSEYGNGSYSENSIRKVCPSLVASGKLIRMQLKSKAWHYAINDKQNLSDTPHDTQDIMSDPCDSENPKRISQKGSIDSNQDTATNTAIDPTDPFSKKDQLLETDKAQNNNVSLSDENSDRTDEKTYTFEIQKEYTPDEIVFVAHPDHYGGAVILERRLVQNKPVNGRHLWMYKCMGLDDQQSFQIRGEYVYSEDAWNNDLIPNQKDVKKLKL